MNSNQQLAPQHSGQNLNGYQLVAAAMPENANGAAQQSLQQLSYQHHLMGGGMTLFSPSMMNPGSFLSMQQPESYGGMTQHQAVNNASAQHAMTMQTGFDASQMQHFNPATPALALQATVAPDYVSVSATTTSAAVSLKGAAAGMSSDEHGKSKTELSSAERAKQNRDRNREHARSTRQRKKAYVSKLRELVEGLHAERNEEARQRRVAIQQLAEVQRVRCGVVQTFLRYHSKYEGDERKWSTIVEDDFWLKQPVTPYRSFRRTEIEKVRRSMWRPCVGFCAH
jgi:hypothetical protein